MSKVELHGLTARGFTQDDAHIFAEQLDEEFKSN
jgi:threonyl-tRNA synthetase